MVDVNVPRFNQAMVAALVGIAFAIQWWPLVAVTAAILALTRLGGPTRGLFTQVYVRLIRPRTEGQIETEAAGPPAVEVPGPPIRSLPVALVVDGSGRVVMRRTGRLALDDAPALAAGAAEF
jgi:hypothetical protein